MLVVRVACHVVGRVVTCLGVFVVGLGLRSRCPVLCSYGCATFFLPLLIIIDLIMAADATPSARVTIASLLSPTAPAPALVCTNDGQVGALVPSSLLALSAGRHELSHP